MYPPQGKTGGRPKLGRQSINDAESDRWLAEHMAGMSQMDICRREGLKNKTVWERLQRARKRLP